MPHSIALPYSMVITNVLRQTGGITPLNRPIGSSFFPLATLLRFPTRNQKISRNWTQCFRTHPTMSYRLGSC
jgi:hypothetical protein